MDSEDALNNYKKLILESKWHVSVGTGSYGSSDIRTNTGLYVARHIEEFIANKMVSDHNRMIDGL